jgi:hypothetical protein
MNRYIIPILTDLSMRIFDSGMMFSQTALRSIYDGVVNAPRILETYQIDFPEIGLTDLADIQLQLGGTRRGV